MATCTAVEAKGGRAVRTNQQTRPTLPDIPSIAAEKFHTGRSRDVLHLNGERLKLRIWISITSEPLDLGAVRAETAMSSAAVRSAEENSMLLCIVVAGNLPSEWDLYLIYHYMVYFIRERGYSIEKK